MAKPEVDPIQGRSCGSCSLCCDVIAVPELDKRMEQRCVYQKVRGCAIYSTRPLSCRTFSCAWLVGHVPAKYKPTRVHAVIHGTKWTTNGGQTQIRVLKVTASRRHKVHRDIEALLQEASQRVVCLVEHGELVQVWQLGVPVLDAKKGDQLSFSVNAKGQLTQLAIVTDSDAADSIEQLSYVDRRFMGENTA